MKTLKGIAANLAFILGSVLLLPIGILSRLFEHAAKGLDALDYAIRDRLPEPRQVFSEAGLYWFWQVLGACGFVWEILMMLALMATGSPVFMLWHLALGMWWAAIITRAWEKRHAN